MRETAPIRVLRIASVYFQDQCRWLFIAIVTILCWCSSILFLVYLARMSWRFDSGRYCCRKWWLQNITSMDLHYSLNLFSLLVGSFPNKNARLNICKCETADQLIRDSWKHRCTTNMLPPSWKRVPFKPIKYLFFVVALLDTRDPINKWCCFQGSRLIWLYSTLRPKASWPRDYG